MTQSHSLIPALLTDKVAIITGASRGLGAQIARQMAAAGAIVCVNYLNSKEAAEAVVADITAAGGQAFAYQADVTELEQVKAMADEVVARYGRIDILVNNALPNYQFNPSADYIQVLKLSNGHTFLSKLMASSRALLIQYKQYYHR